MISNKKPAYSFAHVTPEIVTNAVEVIRAANRGRYSASEVFGAYNAALKKNDPIDTCPTCNISRVRELRSWLPAFLQSEKGAEYIAKHGIPNVADDPGTKNRKPNEKPVVKAKASAPTMETFDLASGGQIVISTNGSAKVNGKQVRAGNYDLANGGVIRVPVGKGPAEYVPPVNPTADPSTVLTDGRILSDASNGEILADGVALELGEYTTVSGKIVTVPEPTAETVVELEDGTTIAIVDNPDGTKTAFGEDNGERTILAAGRYKSADKHVYDVDETGLVTLLVETEEERTAREEAEKDA